MNKYEIVYAEKFDKMTFKQLKQHSILHNKLVDKETNGIYISNEKATELLEALDTLESLCSTEFIPSINEINEREKMVDKLQKALGGQDESN